MTKTLTLNTKTSPKSYNIWFDVMQDKNTKKKYLPLKIREEFGSKKMIKLETFENPTDYQLMSVAVPEMERQGTRITLSIEVSEIDKRKLKTLIEKTVTKAREYTITANEIQQKFRDSTSQKTGWPEAKYAKKVKRSTRMPPRIRSISHAPSALKK